MLRGTVVRLAYRGDTVHCEIRLDASDVTLRMAAPAPLTLAPHDAVTLTVSAHACVPLPLTT